MTPNQLRPEVLEGTTKRGHLTIGPSGWPASLGGWETCLPRGVGEKRLPWGVRCNSSTELIEGAGEAPSEGPPQAPFPRARAPPRGGRGAASGALLRGGAGASRAVTLTRRSWAAAAPSPASAPSMGARFALRPPPCRGSWRAGPSPCSRGAARANRQDKSKGGGGRRSAPGGRPPPALNIMSLQERPLARKAERARTR